MRSEIVVAGENGKEPAEPSVLMMQSMAVHHQDPCSRSVIIHPSQSIQPHQQVVEPIFAPPLPIQSERREFREPELDIGLFSFKNFLIYTPTDVMDFSESFPIKTNEGKRKKIALVYPLAPTAMLTY